MFSFESNNDFLSILQNLYQEYMDKIKTSETVISDLKEDFELKVEFIRDTITIRVESLKMELDKLEEKLNNDLNEIKSNWENGFKMEGVMEFKKEEYYKDMEELERSMKNNTDLNEANLYKFQNKIKALNEYIEKCKDLVPEISFIESESKLNEDVIGKINCLFGFGVGDLIQRIKSNHYNTINIDYCHPCDICILPNDYMLICNFFQLFLTRKNKVIKVIHTIGNHNQYLGVTAACTNDVDAVYLCNFVHNTIIKTDLNLNTQLASFGTYDQKGEDNDHLNCPQGICFSNNSVYVCDSHNKRIQILNEDLIYQQSFQLNNRPGNIKVLNEVACVNLSDAKKICFYDLKTFVELKRYNHYGLVGVLKQGFIEYYYENKSFYFYDKNGDLLEQIQTENDFEISSSSTSIVVNERRNRLIICNDHKVKFNCDLRI